MFSHLYRSFLAVLKGRERVQLLLGRPLIGLGRVSLALGIQLRISLNIG